MALFRLYRHDIQTYKDNTASDTRQIPVGLTLQAYRRGATTDGTGTFADGVGGTIVTHDIGTIVVGDQVFINTDTAVTRTVTSVTATNIVVSGAAGEFTWADGDRIMSGALNRPTLYSDDQGDDSLGSSTTTAAATGSASFYTKQKAIDLILDDGTTQTVSPDQGVGVGDSIDLMDWNPTVDGSANDSPDLQDAIETAIAKGAGEILLPPGTIRLGATVTVNAASNLTIRGAGRGRTTLDLASGATLDFTGACTDVTLERMTIQRAAGTEDQVQIAAACNRVTVRDIHFLAGGIGIDDSGTDTTMVDLFFTGSSWISFIRLASAKRPHIRSLRGRFTGGITDAIDIDAACENARLDLVDIAPVSGGGNAIRVRDTAATTPPRDTVITGAFLSGGSTGTGVLIDTCGGLQFIGCQIKTNNVGVKVDGGTDIGLSSCSIVGAQEQGVDVNGGSFFRMNDISSSDPGIDNTAGTTVHVDVAGTVSNAFINNVVMGNYILGTGVDTNTGVLLRSGAGDNLSVFNCRTQTGKIGTGVSISKTVSEKNVYVDHNAVFEGRTSSHNATVNSRSYSYEDTDTDADTPSVLGVGLLLLNWDGGGGSPNITDLEDGGIGQIVTLENVGTQAITIVDETAPHSNGFSLVGGNVVLETGDSLTVIGVNGGGGNVIWQQIALMDDSV